MSALGGRSGSSGCEAVAEAAAIGPDWSWSLGPYLCPVGGLGGWVNDYRESPFFLSARVCTVCPLYAQVHNMRLDLLWPLKGSMLQSLPMHPPPNLIVHQQGGYDKPQLVGADAECPLMCPASPAPLRLRVTPLVIGVTRT